MVTWQKSSRINANQKCSSSKSWLNWMLKHRRRWHWATRMWADSHRGKRSERFAVGRKKSQGRLRVEAGGKIRYIMLFEYTSYARNRLKNCVESWRYMVWVKLLVGIRNSPFEVNKGSRWEWYNSRFTCNSFPRELEGFSWRKNSEGSSKTSADDRDFCVAGWGFNGDWLRTVDCSTGERLLSERSTIMDW